MKHIENKMYKKLNQNSTDLLIYFRAIILLITTLNLFLNVYIILSFDRFNISFGALTIIISFLGQMSAILGQFGYQYSKQLALIYSLSAFSLVLVSAIFGKITENFLLEISVTMTSITSVLSLLVAIKQ